MEGELAMREEEGRAVVSSRPSELRPRACSARPLADVVEEKERRPRPASERIRRRGENKGKRERKKKRRGKIRRKKEKKENTRKGSLDISRHQFNR